ncbi:hypothetical protein CC80DRAFT_523935 [Byssothecium circinans]|uniref:DUF3669 domain-containing protein n=1 Tax=Byssothecium circinans TaxID=147558 RepID=A0A6A5U227_9PLEO|nr:hypothetical protein CC80DRAFT_523935 [Byssothecium circinans]
MENIMLEEKLDAKNTLKRFLSINSEVSTSSSFAERQQIAVGTRSNFRVIGAGTCGRVFEIPGTVDIFKVANHPGKSTDMLWDDYNMHLRVSEVFDKFGRDQIDTHVPRVKYFVGSADEDFWSENLYRFPNGSQTPSNLLCAERILPLAKPIRHSLIAQYCPESHQEVIKNDISNQDCLVRLYLGKRRQSRNLRFFQLRNFNLHLDQMEALELDVLGFAKSIADAMAILHWAVHIDGNDVEFVLGSAPNRIPDPAQIISKPLTAAQVNKMAPNTSTWSAHLADFKRRITHMWMLDFNRCKDFCPNEEGLEQLVHSFFRNDPYFPRPLAELSKDRELWAVWSDRYLRTSARLAGEKHQSLPKKFIEMVVSEQRRKMQQRQNLEQGNVE